MPYQEWRDKIKPEKKIRSYQHIDDLIDLNIDKDFNKIVHAIKNIKNHQFLPFIKRVETIIRFRKNKEGKAQRESKIRPIMYASHVDSHIYSYYNFILLDEYENYLRTLGINPNVIAYRKVVIEKTGRGKSNIHFAKEVFDYIQTQQESVVVTQDIEGFFDNINHELLKQKICKIKSIARLDDSFFKIFKSLTKYRYIEHKDFEDKKIRRKIKKHKYAIYRALEGVFKENKTAKGIPQGSPISGLLANISLIDFDNDIRITFPDVFYRRYSDDLVFVCKKEQKDLLLQFIDKKIKESKLRINANKSFISYFKQTGENVVCEQVTDGLHEPLGRKYVDYLGLEFSGTKIFLRKNTIQKLKRKQIAKTIKRVSNTIKQKRRKPKKIKNSTVKIRSNYLKKAVEVVNNSGVKKQVLKVTKDRNKARRMTLREINTQL
ncbi:MAG: reverse transcriptase domain-containing protein [bacterium]|nr:reverse transcriptase domain-containing protein [bacterium]